MIEPNFAKGDGLIPAIVQDAETKEVLMMAYMNEQSWEKLLCRPVRPLIGAGHDKSFG